MILNNTICYLDRLCFFFFGNNKGMLFLLFWLYRICRSREVNVFNVFCEELVLSKYLCWMDLIVLATFDICRWGRQYMLVV